MTESAADPKAGVARTGWCCAARRDCRHRRAAGRGFTLLELLVAMAVSALLLALLSQVMGSLQQASRSARDSWAVAAAPLLGRQVLVALLREALPPPPGQPGWALVGGPERVEFNAVPPQALRHGGPIRVRVSVERDALGQSNVVVDFSTLAGVALESLPRHTVLTGLGSASFDYSESTGSEPLAQWRNASRLPALIRLNLRDTSGGARSVVAAAPRRHRVASCRLDLISVECRSDG